MVWLSAQSFCRSAWPHLPPLPYHRPSCRYGQAHPHKDFAGHEYRKMSARPPKLLFQLIAVNTGYAEFKIRRYFSGGVAYHPLQEYRLQAAVDTYTLVELGSMTWLSGSHSGAHLHSALCSVIQMPLCPGFLPAPHIRQTSSSYGRKYCMYMSIQLNRMRHLPQNAIAPYSCGALKRIPVHISERIQNFINFIKHDLRRFCADHIIRPSGGEPRAKRRPFLTAHIGIHNGHGKPPSRIKAV